MKKSLCLITFLSIFLMMSFNYSDLVVTTKHGINVWQALIDNNILNFYLEQKETCAVYPFTLYIIFALWNIPLFLIDKIFHIDFRSSSILLFYAKSILIIFALGCAVLIYKICIQCKLSEQNSKLCSLFWLTSSCVLLPLMVIGQYDVICLFFILLAIYNHKNNWRFLLWATIAITMKYFAVFMIVPIILLREKRITKILFMLLTTYSLSLVDGIIFSKPLEAMALKQELMGRVISGRIENISIFVLLWCIVCLYSFFQKVDLNTPYYYILVSLIGILPFFFFNVFAPYWTILFTPFLCIIVFTNLNSVNIMLETILTASLTIYNIIVHSYCGLEIRFMNNSILSSLFGKCSNQYDSISPFSCLKNFCNDSVIYFLHCITLSIFVAASIYIIVFNIINCKTKQSVKSYSLSISSDTNLRQLIFSRVAINFMICYIPIFIYFYCLYFKH